MSAETLLAFLAVAALAYVTPGPDWFVVMRHAATSRRSGWVASVGVQTGLLVHMTAAAVGVAALVLASAEAFTVLKLVGAAYLVYLGVKAIRESFRHPESSDDQSPAEALPAFAVFRQSFTANVLNPKAALFFVAVIPQFVSHDQAVAPQVVALGLADIALGLAWWAVFVLGIRAVRTALGGRRSRVVIDRVAGTALIGLGGVLATSGRKVA